MKFECTRNIIESKYGETRTVRKFLLIPRSFKSKTTRWLEYAEIVEQVQYIPTANWMGYYGWVEIGFADEMNSDIIVKKDTIKKLYDK